MESWREELYLSHHGIKGQKWGVRNYQYEDGSLTPEGKKRYGSGQTESARIKGKINVLKPKVKRPPITKNNNAHASSNSSSNAGGAGEVQETNLTKEQEEDLAIAKEMFLDNLSRNPDYYFPTEDEIHTEFVAELMEMGIKAEKYTDKQIEDMYNIAKKQYEKDTAIHSGIKGQKWGIRNYQYEDGSFTQEGKIRYGRIKDPSRTTATGKKRYASDNYHDDYKSVHDGRSVKYLSNKELQQRVTRLNNEHQYNKSIRVDYLGKGEKAVKEFTKWAALIGAATTAYGMYAKYASSAVNKIGSLAVKNIGVVGAYH